MNADRRRYFGLIWVAILVLSFSVLGQNSSPALEKPKVSPDGVSAEKFQTLKLKSDLMSREMPYRVILPAGYSALKQRAPGYSVIYLLHGLTGHYSNWTDKTKLAEYAASQNFIIVTPEGDNGWYSDSVTVANDKYESYIVKELIPEIDKNFRTLADRDHRIIAGLSMGGYGSLKFGLKYPEMFTLMGSFSGALGATSYTASTAGAQIGGGIDKIFGSVDSDSRKANDIFRMVREITPERLKSLPYVYQSCGTEDFLIQNNRDFLSLLNEKKVPHEYREHPGVHDWAFWDDQIREFLDVAERRLSRPAVKAKTN